jgi:signal transduction histidine kinase
MNECDYMNRLVEDLLLLSRMDTHRLKLSKERIDLSDLLRETCNQVEKLAGDKEIHLSIGEVQGAIAGDPVRVRQVLLILLDNAIRHTAPGGKIHLESHRQGRAVTIRVADTGSGIAPEHLPHVFERFYQAYERNAEENRNNGLGLPIARSLLEAQGGTIRLESTLGAGTTAILTFPAA